MAKANFFQQVSAQKSPKTEDGVKIKLTSLKFIFKKEPAKFLQVRVI